MNRKIPNDGFILYLALIALSLTATALIILTRLCNAMGADTRRMALEASHRNMTASAMIWLTRNKDNLVDTASLQPLSLDASAFEQAKGSIIVSYEDTPEGSAQISIEIQCINNNFKINRKTRFPAASMNIKPLSIRYYSGDSSTK
ncbi:MAG: hypothetical protein JW860_14655 [Sedimentisphaerales bacterium]|nr:hypothetical protein [Sedimentisphaerales bacterium]